jgi:hypothetical protein
MFAQPQAVHARRLFFVVLTLFCLGMSGDRSPRLSFWHPPHQISEGERIDVQIRLAPDSENRRLTLDAMDREFGESVLHTERQIDPDSAPLQVFRLILPVGDLLLTAKLLGVNGQIAAISTPMVVRSRYGDD